MFIEVCNCNLDFYKHIALLLFEKWIPMCLNICQIFNTFKIQFIPS